MKSRFKKNKNILLITSIFTAVFAVSHLVSVNTFAESKTTVVVDASEEILQVITPAVVQLNLTPINNSNAFGVVDMNIAVATNHPTGYTLSMSTDRTDLERLGEHASENIPKIAAMTTEPNVDGYSASDFESDETDEYTLNRWGYKFSTDSLFIPMTANTDISLSQLDHATNSESVTLNFAAKIDRTLPAGFYGTVFNFTAVASPSPYYMDEIDLWRDELSTAGQYIEDVIDIRDGKTYDVVLLSDGNIWMKDNLELAGGTGLTSFYSIDGVAENSGDFDVFYTLPNSSNGAGSFSHDGVAYVYNSENTACGNNSPCYSYYSYEVTTHYICPVGWELPTKGDFETISAVPNDMTALGLTAGGMMENAALTNSSNGYYWTQTVSNDQPYSFIYNSGSSSFQIYSGKQGQFVRCVSNHE